MTFAPSVNASEAAQRLLLSFVRTNTPTSLFQALPQPRRNNELPLEGDDHDSVVAKESLCIQDARHCWAILKEGFVPRIRVSQPSLLAGKKKRGKLIIEPEEYVEEDRSNSVLAPVAEYAWLVLLWLVELFQRDESLKSGNGSGGRPFPGCNRLTKTMCSEAFAFIIVTDSPAKKRYWSSVGS